MGWVATRSAAVGRIWPRLVRTQILVASVTLAVVAAWRLNTISDMLWPVLMIVPFVILLGIAILTVRGERRLGRATLRAWSASPNSGFFVIPVASALIGPPGVFLGVLIDRFGAPIWALYIWMLRRDAPRKQRTSSSWIDQAPLIALGVGLVLRFVIPAPEWTLVLSDLAAPFMALTGSALFVGSVLHSSQRISPRSGIRPWIVMASLRAAMFLPMVWLAPNPAVGVVAMLCAFSIPTFGPPQMSTVYGYSEPVVAAAARLGWITGAIGLVGAIALTRAG